MADFVGGEIDFGGGSFGFAGEGDFEEDFAGDFLGFFFFIFSVGEEADNSLRSRRRIRRRWDAGSEGTVEEGVAFFVARGERNL